MSTDHSNNTSEENNNSDGVTDPNKKPTEIFIDDSTPSVKNVGKDQSIVSKIDRIASTLFGSFFAKHRHRFEDLEHDMEEAQYEIGNDLYLSRALLYSLVLGLVGLAFGAFVVAILQISGILPQFDTGLRYPEPFATVLWYLRPIIGILLVGIIGYTIFTAISFVLALLYPKYKAGIRKRRIGNSLPYATTFMYALSKGGMDFIDIIEKLSKSTGTYGEVAEEFQRINTDIEISSIDPPQAFRRASERNSNEKFSDFCDDVRGTLDSGANMTDFLGDKSEQYIKDAEQEQESFLDFLELLGEMYVTALVAGPLFLIIILVILALLGGGSVLQLIGIVYLLVPVLNIGFFVFLETVTADDEYLSRTLKEWDTEPQTSEELYEQAEELDSERLETIGDVKAKQEREEFIRNPIKEMKKKPALSLIFSAPLAALIVVGSIILGISTPTLSNFINQPVHTTSFMFVIPFLVMGGPYTILYELNSRRDAKIMSRFPSALNSLSSANSIGLTLTESLETVADNSSGIMGKEFKHIRNKIVWENNVQAALAEFSNRMRVRVITRTMKMIIESSEASGDVEDVLDIASRDVNKQYRLEQKQKQTMMMYTVVILMSFFVYLFVIVMLDTSFLSRVSGGEVGVDGPDVDSESADQAPGGQALEAADGGASVNFDDVPVDQFRLVFYHSTIIQAIGSGLLAGQLMSNDIRKGLKFTLILIVISTLVFFFITG